MKNHLTATILTWGGVLKATVILQWSLVQNREKLKSWITYLFKVITRLL